MKQTGHILQACCYVIFLTGCMTTTTLRTNVLQGMIYDYQNKPVPGYRLTLDSGESTVSDINGRFSFGKILYGTVTISGSAPEYTSYSGNYNFEDRTRILYLRIKSLSSVYGEIDCLIEKAEYNKASEILMDLAAQEHAAYRFKLYSLILKFHTANPANRGEYAEALYKLEQEKIHE